MLIAERVSHDRRYKLVNRRLTIEARDGQPLEERELAMQEFRVALDETLRITSPGPVEQVFARLG